MKCGNVTTFSLVRPVGHSGRMRCRGTDCFTWADVGSGDLQSGTRQFPLTSDCVSVHGQELKMWGAEAEASSCNFLGKGCAYICLPPEQTPLDCFDGGSPEPNRAAHFPHGPPDSRRLSPVLGPRAGGQLS